MKLTILHTNDLHARYEDWLRCAAFIKRRRAELGPSSCLVLDAGDHFDLSVDECRLSRGRLNVDLLADAGVDAFTPGNNEFYRASRETLSALSLESPFPWLLSTVEEKDGRPFAGFRRGVIVDKGVKVGILGALDPMDDAAGRLHGLATLDRAGALSSAAAELRARGAAIVILLSHCGLSDDREIALKTDGAIDVIVGGHSHTEIHGFLVEHRTVIVQAGSLGHYVGELELEIDEDAAARRSAALASAMGDDAAGHGAAEGAAEGAVIVGRRAILHASADQAGPDAAQEGILRTHRAAAQRVLDEVVGGLDRDLPQPGLVRLSACLLKAHLGAEIGMSFGPAASEGLAKGPVRIGDLCRVSQSFLTPATLELQGRQILGLLREREEAAITELRGYGIGFRPQGQPFGRIEFDGVEAGPGGADARVNGEALDPERWYRVGTLTHLMDREGGGYPSLDGSRNAQFVRFYLLRDLLVDSFRKGVVQDLLAKEPA
jgi:2',3'-cyclic-nucleotide 2'-phosphodiesterase (5'-nucleotidase family)